MIISRQKVQYVFQADWFTTVWLWKTQLN